MKYAAILMLVSAAFAQDNSKPNPYRTIENWAKLPEGRSWGSTSAVDIDRDGRSVWVAERCGANSCAGKTDDSVLHFDASGKLVKSFGAGMFLFPHGIAVDKDGNIWITDGQSQGGKGFTVVKFNPDGKVLMMLDYAFNQPNDVAIAPNGDIFVSEGHTAGMGTPQILKFGKDGKFIRKWGKRGSAPGELDVPHALAFDSRGRLFVGDRANNRIQIFDQDGTFLDQWKQFSRPSGLYIDKNDILYVTDSESTDKAGYGYNPGWKRGIRIGSAKDGVVTAFIPDPLVPTGALPATSAAEGVAVDADGVIYGAEVGSKSLKRYVKASVLPGQAKSGKYLELAGVQCVTPPPLHCGEANCPGATVTDQGTALEPKTGRKFFLDYPCDLKRDEKITFVLSLHGAGSYGNWQRHYFPIMDYAQKYRLVIATPNAPPKIWAQVDDEYLQNIVNLVYQQVGKKNIKAFWLAGHSQGGMTSNRLVRTDFFKQRVDGWLSLSGGRLGPTPPIPASFFAAAPGGASKGKAGPPAGIPGAPQGLPDATFSFIFETGEHELGDQPIPDASPWAAKLGCGARVRRPDVVDTKAGYVYDSTRQDPGSDAWGRLPRPGASEVFEYPKCKDGRLVADVVRMGKGHTEGLEPHVTEQLVKLMVAAKK